MAGSTAGSSTLITVAPTGAESEKPAVPALPVTLDELVTTAKECQAAGAAVIHVHIRDDQARPTLDLSRLKDTVAAVREGTDLIVQLSTGGAVTDSFGPAVIERQADALPFGRPEVMPGLGHFGPLQDPGAVAASVRRAFAEAG